MTGPIRMTQWLEDGTESPIAPIGSQAAHDAIQRVKERLYGPQRTKTYNRTLSVDERPVVAPVARVCRYEGCGDSVIHAGRTTDPEIVEEAFRLWIENRCNTPIVALSIGCDQRTIRRWAIDNNWELRLSEQERLARRDRVKSARRAG